MRRKRAALVDGEYVEWWDDTGPSRATNHAGGVGPGKKHHAGPRTVRGTTALTLPSQQANGTRKCLLCDERTLAVVCVPCLVGRGLMKV